MALLGSQANFTTYILKQGRECPECGRKLHKGDEVLASIKNGKVKKIVCSEECRLEFDANLWDWFAKKNAKWRKEHYK